MTAKKLFITFFILIYAIANAQKLELGKVTIADLEQKRHQIDTSAVAAVLFNTAKTEFKYLKTGFYMEHEYFFRIKIYKKEGFNWATKKVNNYIAYKSINDDYVNFSDCFTYNLVNGKIEKTKLKSEGNFTVNLNKYYNQTTITLPNVKVGSILEYKYVIRSEYFSSFPEFDFQQTIPVDYVEYKTEIPEFYIYKQVLKGFFDVKTQKKFKYGKLEFSDYIMVETFHIAENVPAQQNEDFVDNLNNYRATVIYELEKTKFSENYSDNYSVSWKDVAKNIFEDKQFGYEIEQHFYHLEDSNLLLKDKKDEAEKVNIIFNFVQNKMNWNGEHSVFANKSVAKAYEEKTGNSAQINFILIAMLNHAGLNANPVLISTKQNGIKTYPNRIGFDFVIVAVQVAGKQVLLDATNKFSTLKTMPIRNLNWTGRLIKKDGFSEEVDLIPSFVSSEKTNLKLYIDLNGSVSGKIQTLNTDYNALKFREIYGNTNQEAYIENLENNFNNLKISDFKIENNNTNLSKPIIQSYSFVSNNEIEIINNKLYFSPLFFFENGFNPFYATTRTNPIDFEFPKEKSFIINIEIPEGYEVENLPKPINITTGENVANFKYLIEQKENNIQLIIQFNINKTLISQDFYDVLKNFYKQMIDKQNEKIIFKKKQ